jgi:Transglycosylase-like domain
VGQARQAALAEASTDQARLDVLQAQLTSLVAAQAQQAQSKAAAVAAQARPPVQGLPINGGLVAVVQATVSAPPVPAAPPSKVPPATVPSTTLPVVTAAPAPAPAAQSADGGAGGVWLQLRECESSDNYQANTGNGYFGAYQFSQQTWTDLGFPGRPDQAPPAMQDAAAQQLQAESGWGQWPACSAALGLS